MTGFMRNPDLLWVRDEPRADPGSSRTQVCSALLWFAALLCSGSLLCSGFDANPGLLWVCREPRSLLGSSQTHFFVAID
ncbi:hypothetical protein SLEP1_g20738 [Rubroshorea leprosula]|uniref:Uncharacterized protein n=1 Tax=Rubroshorea leprosula TaxID=152421 RepID=A0AAV5JCE9_9ROSI|nr:hypothetical protein SLEP1_g20738 [Rubroshorea leprosula]